MPPAGVLIGVDGQADMLEEFRHAAEAAGAQVRTVHGPWPEVAPEAGDADVAVCGHVLYNVAEAAPFVEALCTPRSAAGRPRAHRAAPARVDDRPMGALPRHRAFRGTDRRRRRRRCYTRSASHPSARTARTDPAGGFDRREDAVALVRRRLCLPASRDDEVAAALGERLREHDGLWSAGPPAQRVVTLWWDV